MNYLPSKKFMIVVLVVVAIITTVSIVRKSDFSSRPLITRNTGDEENSSAQIEALMQELSRLTSDDTDGDGLANWEEAVFGTDPTLRDTDGDGISDYDETRGLQTGESGIDTEPKTETDKFSRQLYTEFMLAKEGGVSDETIQSYLQDEMINFTQSLQENVEYFTEANLNIVEQSEATKVSYRESFLTLLSVYPIDTNDIVMMLTGINNGVFPDDPGLIIEKYQMLVNGLLEIPVPRNVATSHLAFTNATQKLLFSIENMSVFFDDPLLAAGAVFNIGDDLESIQSTLTAISQSFSLSY